VILNLVMNADDAMPNGGRLTLETANVTLDDVHLDSGCGAGRCVMLTVTDTGSGMSPGTKSHVFEPFFTTKPVGQCIGLGLSTCYGIVKQSAGHIAVDSEVGHGTTFKVYLPAVEEIAIVEPSPPADAPTMPRGTETILLVEDNDALREMATTLLRRLGYTVRAVENAAEALTLPDRDDIGHVDLIFADVVATDRFREQYPDTKILFTSFTETAFSHQGGLDPCVAMLQKPFSPSALARKLRDVLGDRPAL